MTTFTAQIAHINQTLRKTCITSSLYTRWIQSHITILCTKSQEINTTCTRIVNKFRHRNPSTTNTLTMRTHIERTHTFANSLYHYKRISHRLILFPLPCERVITTHIIRVRLSTPRECCIQIIKLYFQICWLLTITLWHNQYVIHACSRRISSIDTISPSKNKLMWSTIRCNSTHNSIPVRLRQLSRLPTKFYHLRVIPPSW